MSRQYFDFSGLIADFSNPFTVVTFTDDGYDEAGDWKGKGEKRAVMYGAIISFKESKVFRSEGAITSNDKRLFMQQALPDALIGAGVEYEGHKYMIESEHENAEFTGVYSYLLRHVSAFEGSGIIGSGLVGHVKIGEGCAGGEESFDD